MDMKKLSGTQKLTVSGVVMALYIVVMYLTQSFAFGQYQVRIATAIYACAYLFPFLVLPLGLSNLLANMLMGGLGFFDIVGGGAVGVLTALCCALLGKKKASPWWTALPITLIPALGVSLWLSGLLGVPYWTLAASLLVGQAICGGVGALLVKALKKAWRMEA
ncbi:MAG: QueT transporter family protein [Clostridia bacterium]|nr:QueT transporter family protein [Clostridia bacterium]